MSFFRKIFAGNRDSGSYHPSDSRLAALMGGTETQSGELVNEEKALGWSAAWCATRVLVEMVASLPLVVYRKGREAVRERARFHPSHDLLTLRPNKETDALSFRECMTEWQINAGNAYSEIERDSLGRPVALWPIHPSRVSLERQESGLVYKVSSDNGKAAEIPAADMLHLKGVLPTGGGLLGRGIITHARESIGAAMAAERYGSTYFRNSGVPSVAIETTGKMDPETRSAFRREWKEIHSGSANSGEVAVLPNGWKTSTLTVSHEDAQFLETRQFNIQEASRWYRVPPHYLAEMSRSTFNNIEHQGIEFIVYSLRRWLISWEFECKLKLLTAREQATYYYEHLLLDLLRNDEKSRYEVYEIGSRMGLLSVNDIAARENMPGIGPAGDIHIIPANMINLESLLEEPEVEEVAPMPPALPAPPEEEPEEEDEEEDQEQEQAAISREQLLAVTFSQFELVRAEMRRLITKEINAITRHSKRSDFLTWLDAFLEKQTEDLAQALRPTVSLWLDVRGFNADPAEICQALAREHSKRSAEELLELAGEHTARTFPEAVESLANLWREERPSVMADRVIGYIEGDYHAVQSRS